MEPRPFPNRIRAIRSDDPRQFTIDSHRISFLMASVEPDYPQEAAARGIDGEVTVEVVVGREGEVMEAIPRAGDPVLADAAASAVRQWKYRPTRLNGRPVEVLTEVRVRFTPPDRVVCH